MRPGQHGLATEFLAVGQLSQGAAEATVAVCDAQLLQQSRGAQVQGAVALETGLVARAQACQVLPAPVGTVSNRLCCWSF